MERRVFLGAAARVAAVGAIGSGLVVARASDVPLAGTTHAFTAGIDDWMRGFMTREQAPGASLAITQAGRLVYARGFGHADRETQRPVRPDSLFRIASVSKAITAVDVMLLVERRKLELDQHVAQLLPVSSAADARWAGITLRHLLHHAGGWDERKFDTMFETRAIARQLAVPLPVTPDRLLQFMLTRPLDFDPGAKFAYSNFGYFLLGRAIEAAAGSSYEQFIRHNVLLPCGAKRTVLGRTLPEHAAAGEVRYHGASTGISALGGGNVVPGPYGVWPLELMAANGGWVSSVIDLARFACAFDRDATRKMLSAESLEQIYRRPEGAVGAESGGNHPGMGWFVWPDRGQRHRALATTNGLLDGTGAYVMRRHDGLNWAVLFNKALAPDGRPLILRFRDESADVFNAVSKWPDGDRFGDYD